MEAAWNSAEAYLGPLGFLSIGTFLVHEIAWLAFNLPYLCFDKFGWFQQYKINPKATERNALPQQWTEFRRLLHGHVFQLAPVTLLSAPLLLWLGFTTAYADLPTWQTFLLHFVVYNVVEDCGFYWVHRWMHKPANFRAYHYIHHRYDPPFSLSGEIQHPVEFVLNILLPLMAGPVLCAWLSSTHCLTYWVWLVFRELRGTDSHSNYVLPFHPLRLLSVVGYGGPQYHGVHHNKRHMNTNFGGYCFWDWAMGTMQRSSA